MADKKNDIEGYNNDSLDPKERHALEKKALNDQFLEDALEGSQLISSEELSSDLRELSKKIDRRRPSEWFTPLRMAAGVLILLGTGAVLFLYDFSDPVTLVMEKEISLPIIYGDSVITQKKDSIKSLLTLAEPDVTKPKGSPSSKKTALKKSEPNEEGPVSTELSSASGGRAELQPTQMAKAEEAEQAIVVEDIRKNEAKVASQSATLSQKLDQYETKDADLNAKKESTTNYRSKSIAARDDKNIQNISGQVLSAEDGQALPGVNIVIKGTTTGTVTDTNGNFQLATGAANPKLVFSFIGMQNVEAKPDGSSVNIKMKEDASQLSEVVVTGLGLQNADQEKEPIIKYASPLGGIPAYNKYLETSLRYPAEALAKKIKGKVMIEFTIAANGDMSEFSVLKGLGFGCDEEVIRLVKEGPKWSPTTHDDVGVDTQVKVRVKFDPEKAEK